MGSYVVAQNEAKEIVARMLQGDSLPDAVSSVTRRRLSRIKPSHDLSLVWELVAKEGEQTELSLSFAIEVFLRGTTDSRIALLRNPILFVWCRESRSLLELVQEYRFRLGETESP